MEKLTKEKFEEEFVNLYYDEVTPLDAIMHLMAKFDLTEDQIPKLLSENIYILLEKEAISLNLISGEKEEVGKIDDFF